MQNPNLINNNGRVAEEQRFKNQANSFFLEQEIPILKRTNKILSTPPGIGVEGVVTPQHSYLDEYGYNFARAAKITEDDENHIQLLTAKAESGIEEFECSPYNPAVNAADAETEEKLKELEKDKSEVKEQIRIAEADLIDENNSAANLPEPNGQRPAEPSTVVILSSLLFAIPFGPTFHAFWKIDDFVLNLVVAALLSICMGFALAKLMFYVPPTKFTEDNRENHLCLYASIGVALGLGIFRLAISGDFGVAIGFTVFELFLIALIEIIARKYRKAVLLWDEQKQVSQKTANQVLNAGKRVRDLHARLSSIEIGIEEIRGWKHFREILSKNPAKVAKSCVAAILAGYNRGVAENKAEYLTRVRR